MKIDKQLVENLIENYLPFANNDVYTAVRYSLINGGKRLRPIVLLEMAQALGVFDDNTKRLAVALEMIHTYSLVHDDLPCMDNDDFRRGKPSCHKKFTEAHAVLAGDALLNCAMEVFFGGAPTKNYFDAGKYLFACSGVKGMVQGQSLDLFTTPTTVEELTEVAMDKTGQLFCAGIVCPAIYANASKSDVDALKVVASSLGIAFQIADDLADNEDKGFLAVLGKDKSVDMLNNLLNKCNKAVATLSFDAKILTDFANLIKNSVKNY